MAPLVRFLLVALLAVACQRGEREGAAAPPPGETMPGGPAAEGARVGYADQPMPGPETSVGRATGLPEEPGAVAGTGLEARLEGAEAGARTAVTQPIAIAGTITAADDDSVQVQTTGGENLELLVPLPQERFRSGMGVGPKGELRPGDEIRATYRIGEGKKVADSIEVTVPARR